MALKMVAAAVTCCTLAPVCSAVAQTGQAVTANSGPSAEQVFNEALSRAEEFDAVA